MTITIADRSPENPDGKVRFSLMARVFWTFVILMLLSAVISVGGKLAGRSIATGGHTEDRSLREVVIGSDVLRVPANMIRFEDARRDGIAQRLDLYVLWPQMEGYSHATRRAFNHVDGQRAVIFISFEERMMSRDMSGRFDPIYRPLIDPQGRSGPGGLKVHRFSEKSGYVDEVLVVGEADDGPAFVARCLSGRAAADSLAPCERDIHVGQTLNLVYRFPAELAGSWRELDLAIRQLATDALRPAPSTAQSRSTSRMAMEKL